MTTAITLNKVIWHDFIRTDDYMRRHKRQNEIIAAGSRLEINVTQLHQMNAVKRWSLKKLRAYAKANQSGFIRTDPEVYCERRPDIRASILRVWVDFCLSESISDEMVVLR